MFAAPDATLAELHGQLRAAAEKGLAETRSAYVKTKVAAKRPPTRWRRVTPPLAPASSRSTSRRSNC